MFRIARKAEGLDGFDPINKNLGTCSTNCSVRLKKRSRCYRRHDTVLPPPSDQDSKGRSHTASVMREETSSQRSNNKEKEEARTDIVTNYLSSQHAPADVSPSGKSFSWDSKKVTDAINHASNMVSQQTGV